MIKISNRHIAAVLNGHMKIDIRDRGRQDRLRTVLEVALNKPMATNDAVMSQKDKMTSSITHMTLSHQ